MRTLYCLVFPLCFLVFLACETKDAPITSGKINYAITYPIEIKDKWLERLVPKSMDLYFNERYIKSELGFGLGVKIAYLSDIEELKVFEQLKFLQNKTFSVRQEKDVQDLIHQIPPHEVSFTNDTQTIVGFLCYKAIVNVVGSDSYSFDCWYTKDIQIKTPNWCTPFKEIDGVLIHYQIKRFNILMEITAQKIETLPEDLDVFSIPENYTEVSIEKMQETFDELKEM